jgi:hypothetical protein
MLVFENMAQTLFKTDKNLVKLTIHFHDKEMVSKFYSFLLSEKISPAVKGNDAGNYKFHAFFTTEDSEKIVKFLNDSGAKKCQILPS